MSVGAGLNTLSVLAVRVHSSTVVVRVFTATVLQDVQVFLVVSGDAGVCGVAVAIRLIEAAAVDGELVDPAGKVLPETGIASQVSS